MPSALFFPKIALVIKSLLCFSMNFRIFFHFCKKHHWDFSRDGVDSVHHLSNMNILTVLSLLIQHEISFYLFLPSFLSPFPSSEDKFDLDSALAAQQASAWEGSQAQEINLD